MGSIPIISTKKNHPGALHRDDSFWWMVIERDRTHSNLEEIGTACAVIAKASHKVWAHA